jgi:putative transposase
LLKGGVGKYSEKVIDGVIRDRHPDVQIEEVNAQEDHIHVMIVIPPKYSISKVIGDMKRDSSRILRKKFEYLRRGRESLWAIGYYISSVGLDERRVRNYIKYEQDQESGQREAVWDKGATGKA